MKSVGSARAALIESEARRLYEMNAEGWANAATWERLNADAKRIWLEFAERHTQRRSTK